MAATARSKLVELLKADPTLVAELRELVGDEPGASEAGTVEAIFEGTSTEQPTQSQTGKSVKFEIPAYLDGVEGEDQPKALVVAYLPPEVAAESLTVTVASVGPKAQPRTIKARKRKAS